MEVMAFSREIALERLNRVADKTDRESIRVYEECECFHDAYIDSIEIRSCCHARERADCVITFSQDTLEPQTPKRIAAVFKNVSKINFSMRESDFLGMEVYYMYFDQDNDKVKALCSTDGMMDFEMVMDEFEIRFLQ